jgi:hypothetical protein
MDQKKVVPEEQKQPWWMESGDDQCEFCAEWYHYDSMYFCSVCDRPVCPVCAILANRERIICPECYEERIL